MDQRPGGASIGPGGIEMRFVPVHLTSVFWSALLSVAVYHQAGNLTGICTSLGEKGFFYSPVLVLGTLAMATLVSTIISAIDYTQKLFMPVERWLTRVFGGQV